MDARRVDSQLTDLKQRWRILWRGKDQIIAADCFDKLIGLYGSMHRHYHDWGHIYECLEVFHRVKTQSIDARAVEAAIWFHDAIYDTHRKDNEEKSADLAEEWLAALGENRVLSKLSAGGSWPPNTTAYSKMVVSRMNS